MGLDDIYDYGINSPLNYSSEEEDQRLVNLERLKDHQNQPDQRLVNLERLVTELGEKKPLFNLAPELVIAVCFSMSGLVVALIMCIK